MKSWEPSLDVDSISDIQFPTSSLCWWIYWRGYSMIYSDTWGCSMISSDTYSMSWSKRECYWPINGCSSILDSMISAAVILGISGSLISSDVIGY